MKIEKEHLCEDCGKPTERYHTAVTCFNCAKIREHKSKGKHYQSIKAKKLKWEIMPDDRVRESHK